MNYMKKSKAEIREGTAASYRISVITLTPALAAYKQKLFNHIQAKGGAMFGNFIFFTQPLLHLILLHWTFKLCNRSLSVATHTMLVWMNCAVPVMLGRSSKFRCTNVNNRLKRLNDIILICLFLTSFLPMHSIALPYTMHMSCITYSSSCKAHVCFTYAQYYYQCYSWPVTLSLIFLPLCYKLLYISHLISLHISFVTDNNPRGQNVSIIFTSLLHVCSTTNPFWEFIWCMIISDHLLCPFFCIVWVA